MRNFIYIPVISSNMMMADMISGQGQNPGMKTEYGLLTKEPSRRPQAIWNNYIHNISLLQ